MANVSATCTYAQVLVNHRINGTAEHCCICIPGRACVERFVDLLAAPPILGNFGPIRVPYPKGLINGNFASNRKDHSLCFYALRVLAAEQSLKPPKNGMNEI